MLTVNSFASLIILEAWVVTAFYNKVCDNLVPGEFYHLIYDVCVNGRIGCMCESNLKCIKVESERYLFERNYGVCFRIRFKDIRYLFD